MAEPSTDATTIKFPMQLVMQLVGMAITVTITVNAATWEMKASQREQAVQQAAQYREMQARMQAQEDRFMEFIRKQEAQQSLDRADVRYLQSQMTELNILMAENGIGRRKGK